MPLLTLLFSASQSNWLVLVLPFIAFILILVGGYYLSQWLFKKVFPRIFNKKAPHNLNEDE